MLRTPAELTAIGFTRSRVVIVNECHGGMARCRRTREVGRSILPAAHAAGVRHLAMEALYPSFADEANRSRRLRTEDIAYLAQNDMRVFIADALALGWDLVAYEADFNLRPRKDGEQETLEDANWRDEEEAGNIARFLASMPTDTKLLVWCGNSHQRKTPQQWHAGGDWVRLGQRLVERGFDPFVIDQSPTVEYSPGESPRRDDAERSRSELEALGGTAGFLREEDPSPRWRDDPAADAYVLSLSNVMDDDA